MSESLGYFGGLVQTTLSRSMGKTLLSAKEVDLNLESVSPGFDITRQFMLCYNFAKDLQKLSTEKKSLKLEEHRYALQLSLTEGWYEVVGSTNLSQVQKIGKALRETVLLEDALDQGASQVRSWSKLERQRKALQRIKELQSSIKIIEIDENENIAWTENSCAWLFSTFTRAKFNFYPEGSSVPEPFRADSPVFKAPWEALKPLWSLDRSSTNPIDAIQGFLNSFSHKKSNLSGYKVENYSISQLGTGPIENRLINGIYEYYVPKPLALSTLRPKILESLVRGRAVGMQVKVAALYGQTEDLYRESDGSLHAMSIIGMKCPGGVSNLWIPCKLLIRNSWGKEIPTPLSFVSGVEFEHYSSFWMSEGYLIDSDQSGIQIISYP
jgi:hypothetical protein